MYIHRNIIFFQWQVWYKEVAIQQITLRNISQKLIFVLSPGTTNAGLCYSDPKSKHVALKHNKKQGSAAMISLYVFYFTF